MSMNSTTGTIKHRFQTERANRGSIDVSRDRWNDSEVVASAAPDGAVIVRDSTNSDGWGFSRLPRTHYLGGSRMTSLPLASGWSNAPDWVDIELDMDDYGDLNTRVRVEALVASGFSVTPRLYNVTDAEEAGIGLLCSGYDTEYPDDGMHQVQTFPFLASGGLKKFRLQGLKNHSEPTYLIGYLEIGGE